MKGRPVTQPLLLLRVVISTSFVVATLANMETAMGAAVVSQKTVQVEHITVVSTKTFEEAEAALEKLVPQFDPAILDALSKGDLARAKELERGFALLIFLKRDHGALLKIHGRPAKALQYEIGNPITAASMTQHRLPAALYAPLRLALYENEKGGATFEYDKPSSLFGQFGDERVAAVGRDLDEELEQAVRGAAE
jgi:hypothetical protein